MSMMSSQARDAGQLILSQLSQFNRAVVFYESQLEPAFIQGLEQRLDDIARENGWQGDLSWARKGHWFAPSAWQEAGMEKAYIADFLSTDSERDYWLAVVTGQGTLSGAQWGYQLVPEIDYFGDSKAFNAWVSKEGACYAQPLIGMQFQDKGKGVFFLPVVFDAGQLAACWQEHGEFPAEHVVFAPLALALEKIATALPLYDQLLAAAESALC